MGAWFWYHLNLRMHWVGIWPPKVWHIAAFLTIVPRSEKMRNKLQFPSLFAFCGPMNYFFFCIFKAIFDFFSYFYITNTCCFYCKWFLCRSKTAAKEYTFFPKNSLNLSPISSLEIKKYFLFMPAKPLCNPFTTLKLKFRVPRPCLFLFWVEWDSRA